MVRRRSRHYYGTSTTWRSHVGQSMGSCHSLAFCKEILQKKKKKSHSRRNKTFPSPCSHEGQQNLASALLLRMCGFTARMSRRYDVKSSVGKEEKKAGTVQTGNQWPRTDKDQHQKKPLRRNQDSEQRMHAEPERRAGFSPHLNMVINIDCISLHPSSPSPLADGWTLARDMDRQCQKA